MIKPVTIILTQEPKAGFFRVARFVNTCQLSVGQVVPVSLVENWCSMLRVTVKVDGMTPETEDSTNLLADSDLRVNALEESK
jgi:hypothetical protein